MGSAAGAAAVAAMRAGVTVDEYLNRVASGEKYCWRCKEFHPRSAFSVDKHRSGGLAAACRESTSASARALYMPKPHRSRFGLRTAPARDGDKRQARARVNRLVAAGRMPSPNEIPCADCGHEYADGERRHEYDHHLGYAAEHHLHVEAVCTTCHHRRESDRRDV